MNQLLKHDRGTSHIWKKKLSRVKWIASQFLYNGIGKTTVATNVLVKFTGEKIMILYYAARLQCFFFFVNDYNVILDITYDDFNTIKFRLLWSWWQKFHINLTKNKLKTVQPSKLVIQNQCN